MAKFKPLPPLEELRARFDYDPETGVIHATAREKFLLVLPLVSATDSWYYKTAAVGES